ncbi:MULTISPECIES: alpha/beta hydrolase [Rhizobium]|uniref:alpha/beta hydrolase n=1 Tax=Rhizobium TaxID=379 RepID=UPI0019582DE0|nr:MULTISPECIES: esterase [Rhizobium]MBM7047899.1 esterase [Rhizobium lusitanum]
MPEQPDFHFITGRAEHSSAPLLLLHGSGSDEASFVPLADAIGSQRPYMALRGAIDWEGGFAFFRRNPDRGLDHVDLDRQTERLCRFIRAAIERKLLAQPPVLLGFSNGAIMATSILRRQPELALAAILMRPLSPAPGAEFASMPALPILITAGEHDQRREPGDADLVKQQFANAGADVSALVLPTDHGLHQDEADIIRDWLTRKGI